MTHLSGTIRIEKDKHRLYSSFSTLVVITASITKAFNLTANVPVVYNIGDHASFECAQFPVEVRLPLVGPIELVISGLEPNSIAVGIEGNTIRSVMGTTPAPGWSLQTVYNNIVTPIFTDFFESNVEWLLRNVNSDRRRWPNLWNFARVMVEH